MVKVTLMTLGTFAVDQSVGWFTAQRQHETGIQNIAL
jgi:hypothetical protein